MKLLYRTAEWHSLAKLRMHTDSTLTLLETLTTEFGKLMRQFRDLTCSEFDTAELPREIAARQRRQTALQAARSSAPAVNGGPLPTPAVVAEPLEETPVPAVASTNVPKVIRKKKGLNLTTVKFHFLGDYVHYIRHFGTSDSYSTQLVCLCYLCPSFVY
jgi:hypothetical protein